MTRRTNIKSACVAHPAIFVTAGAILLRPGAYRMPNSLTASMRAGSAVDLDRARLARVSGHKGLARGILEFARDARIFLTNGVTK